MKRLFTCLVLLWTFAAGLTPAKAITQQEFNMLLAGLGSASFQTRHEAEATLTNLATRHQLSAVQIAALQNLVGDANLEVRMRAERIFGAFVRTLPSYQTIHSSIQVQLIRPATFDPITGLVTQPGRFTFDEATGSFRNPATYANFRLLDDAWDRANRALLVGNSAAARRALQDLRNSVAMLPAGAFVFNFLDPGNGLPRLTRDDILTRIDSAISDLRGYDLDLQFFGAQNDFALPPNTPVLAAGLLPLGQSLQLSLATVSTAGSLLVTSSDDEGAPALAPPGFAFLGPVFVFQAEDGLQLSGAIGIGIEYGSAELLGIPPSELDTLQIVRIANGQDFLLTSTLAAPDFLVAEYSPIPNIFDTDQFGVFGIVRRVAVPEPADLGLVVIGCALVIIFRTARRPWHDRSAAAGVPIAEEAGRRGIATNG